MKIHRIYEAGKGLAAAQFSGYCDSRIFKLFRWLDDVAYPARYQRVVAKADYWLLSIAADAERSSS